MNKNQKEQSFDKNSIMLIEQYGVGNTEDYFEQFEDPDEQNIKI